MAFQKERRVLQVKLVVPFVFRSHYLLSLPGFSSSRRVEVIPWANLQ